MKTEVGGRSGANPLKLSMPVMIAPMSYGALSKSAKLALAIASRLSGISENTGEGGMSKEQRDEADQLIYQCLAGRLGWNIHDMQKANGLEIYISQGAKPGLGGQLMAKKVTPEIARIRGIPAGIDLRSPSRHPDVLGADDLVIKVEEFREATGYRVPVSVKLGAGRVRDDIKIAWKDGFDFVELDGMQGSTGAAGNEVLEFVGIPTLSAIQEARDALTEVGGLDMPDRADGRHQGRHRHHQGAGAWAPMRWRWAPRPSSPAAASPACSAMPAPASPASPRRTRSTRSATTFRSRPRTSTTSSKACAGRSPPSPMRWATATRTR